MKAIHGRLTKTSGKKINGCILDIIATSAVMITLVVAIAVS